MSLNSPDFSTLVNVTTNISSDTDAVAAGGATVGYVIQDLYINGSGSTTVTFQYTRGGSTVTKTYPVVEGGQVGMRGANIRCDLNTPIEYQGDGSVNNYQIHVLYDKYHEPA
jgi:hypothetical protein